MCDDSEISSHNFLTLCIVPNIYYYEVGCFFFPRLDVRWAREIRMYNCDFSRIGWPTSFMMEWKKISEYIRGALSTQRLEAV